MNEPSPKTTNRLLAADLPSASTVCNTCIFADYKDGVQIGCKADRIKYFENANIPMAQFDDGDTISVVIEGKTCVYYRPKDWATTYYGTSSTEHILRKVKQELSIPYHTLLFIRSHDSIEDIKSRLLELQNQKIKPRILTLIDRSHQIEIISGDVIKLLNNDYHFDYWRLQTIQATDQLDLDIIDLAYDNTKSHNYMFYIVLECSHAIPSTMSEEIHKSIHDDMKAFTVLLPNSNGVGRGALKVAHAKHAGNSFAIPLEDKITHYDDSPHLIKQVEEICPSFQTS